jgi:glutathione synthase/RimK-type ligase-like ATP-grasp enzyme
MVLLCGIPTESPLLLVRDRLDDMGTPFLVLSQRRFAQIPFRFRISDGCVTGEVVIDRRTYPLEDFFGVYTRLMDFRSLPEVSGEPAGSAVWALAHDWHDAVSRWLEVSPARVVNRSAPMGSNASKPFQAQAVTRRGLFTPETLVTNDPDLARAFIREHGRVVYKSISGVRSIVREVDAEDLARLDRIPSCPVQFQAYVDGRNIRVHTVGTEVFATGITTDATDYRYAHRQRGQAATLEALEISDDLAAQCLALAQDLELPLAGIDLKITPQDEAYCFEVNPSPAYSYYESQTGQPISAAIARYLAGLSEA